jgi:hypothetical protein
MDSHLKINAPSPLVAGNAALHLLADRLRSETEYRLSGVTGVEFAGPMTGFTTPSFLRWKVQPVSGPMRSPFEGADDVSVANLTGIHSHITGLGILPNG